MPGQDELQSFRYRPSVGWTDSYKGSSIPFLSSSIAYSGSVVTEIRFPQVTKSIAIKNTQPAASASAKVRVGFSLNGVQGKGFPANTTGSYSPGPNNNFIVLDNEESYSADHRVTKVFLMAHEGLTGTVQVAAGLTAIHFSELPQNWSGSAGVG